MKKSALDKFKLHYEDIPSSGAVKKVKTNRGKRYALRSKNH